MSPKRATAGRHGRASLSPPPCEPMRACSAPLFRALRRRSHRGDSSRCVVRCSRPRSAPLRKPPSRRGSRRGPRRGRPGIWCTEGHGFDCLRSATSGSAGRRRRPFCIPPRPRSRGEPSQRSQPTPSAPFPHPPPHGALAFPVRGQCPAPPHLQQEPPVTARCCAGPTFDRSRSTRPPGRGRSASAAPGWSRAREHDVPCHASHAESWRACNRAQPRAVVPLERGRQDRAREGGIRERWAVALAQEEWAGCTKTCAPDMSFHGRPASSSGARIVKRISSSRMEADWWDGRLVGRRKANCSTCLPVRFSCVVGLVACGSCSLAGAGLRELFPCWLGGLLMRSTNNSACQRRANGRHDPS